MSNLIESDLCDSERQLFDLIRDLNFGRIEHLQFRNGQPMLEPRPRIVRAVKMAHPARTAEKEKPPDGCPKQSLVELLALMRRTGDGELLVIEIRHGLPFLVEIEWLGISEWTRP
jgi:hypothetical protein